MRQRLPRLLLTAATVTSLVLCAGTAGVWVRSSLGTDDSIYVHTRASRYRLDSENGAIVISRFVAAPADRARRAVAFYSGNDNYELRHYGVENSEEDGRASGMWAGEPGSYALLGLGVRPKPNWAGATAVVRLPDWFVLATVGSPLLVRLLKRRRARASRGLCTVCGYDLRASPERCPECGTVATERP
jgi:hypothetical protein